MNGEIFHKLQNEFAGVEDPVAKDIVEKIVISAPWLSEAQLEKEHRNFDAWINGYGPLQEILTDRKITDLFVNGSDSVWVDKGFGLQRITSEVGNEKILREFINFLALKRGRLFDDAHPFFDAEIERGLRLHAILSPLVEGGIHISIRSNQSRAGSSSNWLDPEVSKYLFKIVRARKSFLVSGGTGAGKTTLLSAMLEMTEVTERILILEDTHELRIDHPHVVQMQSKLANSDGAGEWSLQDLIRQALRMRPTRIVMGEVRGREIIDFLLALNTGHEGGCGTIHANSAKDVPSRIAALGLLHGVSREAMNAQLGSAFDLLIHLHSVNNRRSIESINIVKEISGVVEIIPAITINSDFGINQEIGFEEFESML
jgi:pilus assembly protein CpaF